MVYLPSKQTEAKCPHLGVFMVQNTPVWVMQYMTELDILNSAVRNNAELATNLKN